MFTKQIEKTVQAVNHESAYYNSLLTEVFTTTNASPETFKRFVAVAEAFTIRNTYSRVTVLETVVHWLEIGATLEMIITNLSH